MKTFSELVRILLIPPVMKGIRILGLVGFLCACGSSLGGLTPPPPASDQRENPGDISLAAGSQLLAFQGSGEIAVGDPLHVHVPLPAAALGARLHLYGQKISSLHYTELPEHTHETPNGATANRTIEHQHRLLINNLALAPFGLAGTAAVTGTGGCGFYANQTAFLCNQSGSVPLVEPTTFSHNHAVTIEPTGIPARDDTGTPYALATTQKTYTDHLRVFLDGEEITARFDLLPIGDGTKDHPFNTNGTLADLSDLLTVAGHHRFTFLIEDAHSPTSKGGGLQYVLWLRIAAGTWEEGLPQ